MTSTLAGVRVRLRFAGGALEPLLFPALAHLQAAEATASDPPALTVSLFDTACRLGEPTPAPAWGPEDYGVKGEIVGFNDERIRTVFQPGVLFILHLYDAHRRSGILLGRRTARRALVGVELSPAHDAPLVGGTHTAAARPCGRGRPGGRGVLVAGNSGAGKSTTTLACLEAGLDYVGDDYVLVDAGGAHGAQPVRDGEAGTRQSRAVPRLGAARRQRGTA